MSKVWVLQHIDCEHPGLIGELLAARGIDAAYIRTDERMAVPDRMDDAAGLIVMGGPMGVEETALHPHLTEEVRLIEAALRDEKPILGICLGSQLLASALGARIYSGAAKEIGWYPVSLTREASEDRLWRGLPSRFTAFHWHGDRFDLPGEATALASSASTPIQAFRYGRNAYGFLFHMEVTVRMIETMIRTFSVELYDAGIDGREIAEQNEAALPPLQAIGREVFGRWAEEVKTLIPSP